MKKESSNLENNKLDKILKSMDIDAANIEKIGAIFLSFGYSTFINATNIDILEACEKNNTGIKSANILAFGQKFTVFGYFLLFIAASKRVQVISTESSEGSKNNTLSIFQNIKTAYLGSLILNYLRLVEFIELSKSE